MKKINYKLFVITFILLYIVLVFWDQVTHDKFNWGENIIQSLFITAFYQIFVFGLIIKKVKNKTSTPQN